MGSFMSGGGKQVKTSGPWSGQVPYLTGDGQGKNPQGIFPAAAQAYGQTPKTPFSGQYFAGPDWRQTQAIDQGTGIAQALGGQGQALHDVGQATARGDFLNPASNPYFTSWLDASFDPLIEKFQREIIPGLTENRIMNSAYEYGPREAIAEGLATSDLTNQMSRMSKEAGLQMYNTERDRQLASGDVISQAAGLQMMPAQLLAALGGQMQGFQQTALNEQQKKYADTISAPWQGLPEYAGIVQGNYGGTQTIPGPSTAQNIFSGLAGGLSMGAGLGDLMGAEGLSGMWPYLAGGGILGGLGGMF